MQHIFHGPVLRVAFQRSSVTLVLSGPPSGAGKQCITKSLQSRPSGRGKGGKMKKPVFSLTLAAFLCGFLTADFPWCSEVLAQEQLPKEAPIRINGSVLTPEQIRGFESLYGVSPVPGDYWYDAVSGLYGVMGQQAAGMMMPGHMLGVLPEDASGGDTGVFMNGRELTAVEVNYIDRLLGAPSIPGRYWLDAYGNCGIEGLPIPVVNFYQVSRMRFGSGGGDNFWSTHFSAGNFNNGNTQGYVSVPGHGPVGYGF
jgi:hypothetical protein